MYRYACLRRSYHVVSYGIIVLAARACVESRHAYRRAPPASHEGAWSECSVSGDVIQKVCSVNLLVRIEPPVQPAGYICSNQTFKTAVTLHETTLHPVVNHEDPPPPSVPTVGNLRDVPTHVASNYAATIRTEGRGKEQGPIWGTLGLVQCFACSQTKF